MSDLITNVIRGQLYKFTIQQCAEHNADVADEFRKKQVIIDIYGTMCFRKMSSIIMFMVDVGRALRAVQLDSGVPKEMMSAAV